MNPRNGKKVRIGTLCASTVLVGIMTALVPLEIGAQRTPPPQPPRSPRPVSSTKSPLIGTVSPGALGPAAPVARKIGGLETRPLGSAPTGNSSSRLSDRRGGGSRQVRGGRPYSFVYFDEFGNGYYPIAVADAPYLRSGAIIRTTPGIAGSANSVNSNNQPYVAGYATGRWFPTVDRPTWKTDTTVVPVQAWRDLIVNDVICDRSGVCVEREQKVRAPWVAVCRCYMFADAIGRRWEVQ